jgi:lactate racemase
MVMKHQTVISQVARLGESMTPESVAAVVAEACPARDFARETVLLIIPDGTRTAPIGLLFKELHRQLGSAVQSLDILVALGTHQPMSEEAICQRLEITLAERNTNYSGVRFFNHAWNDPLALQTVGSIPAEEIKQLSGGRFEMEVPVQVNRLIFQYTRVIILGPVFPHEVVGFSGGNKYLFPGIAGPEIVNFFHWLGALISNPMIIGHKWTPIRRVVDRAAALVSIEKSCFSLVVAPGNKLAGLFYGTPESAWDAASELSRQLHIVRKERPFHTILSCAPPMYDELWTAGKCMYKLEPVLADDGELIIYAPHLSEVCVSHREHIEAVGYHCRDYFVKQWDQFKHRPWGVLAHCTHVYGQGTFEDGQEKPRARVVLATQLSQAACHKLNLGYRDPATIQPDDFAHRESEGVLLVPHAGELLYQLTAPPSWACGV